MSKTDIDLLLNEVQHKLHMMISASKRLKIVENEIDIVSHDLRVQKKKMNDELEDVKRLEKTGIKSLFNRVLGDLEKQLEKERQEHIQEVLTYNSLVDELEVLQYEEKILKKKASLINETEKHYELLLNHKERIILLSYPKHTKNIKLIDGQIIVTTQLIKETEEAIFSGNEVLKLLEQMISQLKFVKQWGPMKMRGKAQYSSYAKKGYIDRAQKLVGVVQVKFNIFEKELKDLYPDFDLNLDNFHFKAFIRNFYDGLITDWIVVKNLQVALNSVVSATHKVNRLLSMLNAEQESLKEKKSDYELEKIKLIKSIDLN